MLWIFVIFSYLYADIFLIHEPGIIQKIAIGSIDGIQFAQGFLLGATILMETAIIMVFLSRFLKRKTNRMINIIVGIIHTLVILLSSIIGSEPSLHYVYLMTITLLIVWLAWKWPNFESNSNDKIKR